MLLVKQIDRERGRREREREFGKYDDSNNLSIFQAELKALLRLKVQSLYNRLSSTDDISYLITP